MPEEKWKPRWDRVYRAAPATVLVLVALHVARYLPSSPPEPVHALLDEAVVGAWLFTFSHYWSEWELTPPFRGSR